MEMGESRKALPHEVYDRNAFCKLSEALKGENCMMGDGGFECFPQVRLVRQACGFGRGAFVGDAKKLFLGAVGFEFKDDELYTHMQPDVALRYASAKLYEVGCASNVGDCDETSSEHSLPASTSIPALSSNTSRQLTCQVADDEIGLGNQIEAVYEAGNRNNGLAPGTEAGDCASPRISFSRDFAMVDIGIGAPNNSTQSSSPRLSPEKRKWEQQDCYSSDFQFSSNAPTHKGIGPTKEGLMISADELFCNGKLLPLPYPSSRMSYDDLCLPSTSGHYGDQQAAKVPFCKTDGSRPLARHLSFELVRPNFAACTAPRLHASLEPPSSACASMPIASPSHFLCSSPSPKYSLRFKEMFKLKKVSTDGPPDPELTRDSSFTSTCRLPISPRSFWPFSRNGSGSESKTDTSSFARSNILDRVASTSSKGSDGSEDASNTKIPGRADAFIKDDSHTHVTALEMEVPHAEAFTKSHSQVDKLSFNTASMHDVRERSASPPAFVWRGYRSPSDVFKNRACATRSFARGSPGRRGGNANKVLLKNLERCSTEKKLARDGWKGPNKRGPYTAAACRVSPVLHVALYKGGSTSKNGFFGFSNLFSSRKNKKSMEAAINWRKGA